MVKNIVHYCNLKSHLLKNNTSIKSTSSYNNGTFKIYLKSIVQDDVDEEEIKGVEKSFFGVGIVIRDKNDTLVLESGKLLFGNEGHEVSSEVAGIKAFIEGLDAAVSLGLNKIDIISDNDTVFRLITGKLGFRGLNYAALIEEATLLVSEFRNCHAYVLNRDHDHMLFAVKLARDVMMDMDVLMAKRKELIETCGICYTDTNIDQMFSAHGCGHRYCFDCLDKHVQAKLRQGVVLPKFPHEGCVLELKLNMCKKFLSPTLFDLWSERLKETTIPASQKVYCPYPRCSALMSISDLQGCTHSDPGATRCIKCDSLFCITCRVAWHSGMTCFSFKQCNPSSLVEEETLRAFATNNSWRQCSMCNHIISLSEGCNHITCRCGHEFCYLCGAKWKTCGCRHWDERNIIYP